VLGLGTGALLGLAFATQSPWIAGPAFFVLLGLSGWLAHSGEPVAKVEDEAPKQDDPLWADIPSGHFLMGSPADEEGRSEREGPIHEVRISAFRCMRAPVTQKLYQSIMADDPSLPDSPPDDHPVTEITWFDAIEFCNRWSTKDELHPCYIVNGSSVKWDNSANGYRLLTEAEWEYACRAGSKHRWYFGDGEESLSDHAWFEQNSDNKKQFVRQKKPNPYGLFDMHGNVFEWCWDWFGDYSDKNQINPKGPSEGIYKVLRGGSFYFSARFLRSASRGGVQPGDASRDDGFRCARGPRREL